MRTTAKPAPHIRVAKRSGFAMPMTILVLLVLAVGLTGSLAFMTSERRVIDNIAQQANAFLTAQSGLNKYLTGRKGLGLTGMPGATETVTLNIRDGTAEIVLYRLRPEVAGSDALYVVRSTGVIPGLRPQDPDARRAVAQLATWQKAEMEVTSGWTALTGLHKNGSSGMISGEDSCGAQASLPGVSTPTSPGMTVSGGSFEPDGDPPVEDMGTVDDAIATVGFDWEGMVNMTGIIPDVQIPGDSWPSFADPDFWPIVHVTGDFTMPSGGRGILIVTGGLTIGGSDQWEGVVLVGDHLTSNGNNRVLGATYTGLNAMLEEDPEAWAAAMGQNALGNGNKTFRYDSCKVQNALQALEGFVVMENAWMDNWPAT